MDTAPARLDCAGGHRRHHAGRPSWGCCDALSRRRRLGARAFGPVPALLADLHSDRRVRGTWPGDPLSHCVSTVVRAGVRCLRIARAIRTSALIFRVALYLIFGAGLTAISLTADYARALAVGTGQRRVSVLIAEAWRVVKTRTAPVVTVFLLTGYAVRRTPGSLWHGRDDGRVSRLGGWRAIALGQGLHPGPSGRSGCLPPRPKSGCYRFPTRSGGAWPPDRSELVDRNRVGRVDLSRRIDRPKRRVGQSPNHHVCGAIAFHYVAESVASHRLPVTGDD